jgi:hypothetical protein
MAQSWPRKRTRAGSPSSPRAAALSTNRAMRERVPQPPKRQPAPRIDARDRLIRFILAL